MSDDNQSPNGREIWGMLLLIAALAAVLVLVIVPQFTRNYGRHSTSSVNNARQIHIAAQSAALDRIATGDETLGWPGEIPVKSGVEFAKWLVSADYLSENDLRVFTAPGIEAAKDLKSFSSSNLAFTIYRISESDAPEAIFLTSKNYDYLHPLDPKRQPFEGKGFIVFRKDGVGSAYTPEQHGSEDLIGTLPMARPAVLPAE